MRWLMPVIFIITLATGAMATTKDSLYGSTWIEDTYIYLNGGDQHSATVLKVVAASSNVKAAALLKIKDVYKNYWRKGIVACSLALHVDAQHETDGYKSAIRMGRALRKWVQGTVSINMFDSVSTTDSIWGHQGFPNFDNNLMGGIYQSYMNDSNQYATDFDATTGYTYNTGTADSLSTGVWIKIDLTVLFKGWANHRFAEFGVGIYPSIANSYTYDTLIFASTEAASNQPYVLVYWDATTAHEKYIIDKKFFKDSWINSSAATTNYGTADTTKSIGTTVAWNAKELWGFPGIDSATGDTDFTGPGMILDSGVFFCRNNASTSITTVSLYAVIPNWTETGVTWNKIDGTTNWTTAGCEGAGTDYALNADSVSTPGLNGGLKADSARIDSLLKRWYTNGTYKAANGMVRWNRSGSSTKTWSHRSNNARYLYKPTMRIWFHDQPVPGNNTRKRRMQAFNGCDALWWREHYCLREPE